MLVRVFKDLAKYRLKDWCIAFLVLAFCYAAGEISAWALGLDAAETTVWFRVLERTYYGVFPVAAVGTFVGRILFGKWPWEAKRLASARSNSIIGVAEDND